jgi:hypothetical protein
MRRSIKLVICAWAVFATLGCTLAACKAYRDHLFQACMDVEYLRHRQDARPSPDTQMGDRLVANRAACGRSSPYGYSN